MDSTDGNGLFSIIPISSSRGSVGRIMKESQGTYFVSSGYLDEMFSVFANGQITVGQAKVVKMTYPRYANCFFNLRYPIKLYNDIPNFEIFQK